MVLVRFISYCLLRMCTAVIMVEDGLLTKQRAGGLLWVRRLSVYTLECVYVPCSNVAFAAVLCTALSIHSSEAQRIYPVRDIATLFLYSIQFA